MIYSCKECGFELWNPIAELPNTFLALYDDGRYPGRCILSLKEHHEELHQLDPGQMIAFMRDVQTVGAAIQKVTEAPRINYAILGNAVPHIHAHIFPRQLPRDPVPNSSPWNHPKKVYPLKPKSKDQIIHDLAKAVKV